MDKPDLNLEDKKADDDPNDPKVNPKQNIEAVVGANVQLTEENSPFLLDQTKRDSKTGRYIAYKGPGLVRIMDAAAWKAAHVDSDDYFEWNYLNHKRIPIEAFNDAQLQYMLRIDGRFEIVEITE